MTRIKDLLAARMESARKNDKGFTLIELLVVVIIIGILAAVAIPVYIGVQNNAKDSSVKSDVANMKTAAVSLQTQNNGALPGKFNAAATTSAGFVSTGTPAFTSPQWMAAGATFTTNATQSLNYGPSATGFCVIGVSTTAATNIFYATDSTGVSTNPCTIS